MLENMRKIIWTGDSTVARNSFSTYPQTGIGQGMERYLQDDVLLLNLAVNGRSTKSFIDEQRLVRAYFDLAEEDFLFIQFGHNDQKMEDPNRYADPWGEFRVNLGKFVAVSRNRSAYPVLITPVARRLFGEDRKIIPNHGDYPAAMIATAQQLQVPLIDLYSDSIALLNELGDERSKELFMCFPPGQYERFPEGAEDNTHLTAKGARVFAELIAKRLWALGAPYRDLLAEAVAELL